MEPNKPIWFAGTDKEWKSIRNPLRFLDAASNIRHSASLAVDGIFAIAVGSVGAYVAFGPGFQTAVSLAETVAAAGGSIFLGAVSTVVATATAVISGLLFGALGLQGVDRIHDSLKKDRGWDDEAESVVLSSSIRLGRKWLQTKLTGLGRTRLEIVKNTSFEATKFNMGTDSRLAETIHSNSKGALETLEKNEFASNRGERAVAAAIARKELEASWQKARIAAAESIARKFPDAFILREIEVPESIENRLMALGENGSDGLAACALARMLLKTLPSGLDLIEVSRLLEDNIPRLLDAYEKVPKNERNAPLSNDDPETSEEGLKHGLLAAFERVLAIRSNEVSRLKSAVEVEAKVMEKGGPLMALK